jgi:hypothetical protein
MWCDPSIFSQPANNPITNKTDRARNWVDLTMAFLCVLFAAMYVSIPALNVDRWMGACTCVSVYKCVCMSIEMREADHTPSIQMTK